MSGLPARLQVPCQPPSPPTGPMSALSARLQVQGQPPSLPTGPRSASQPAYRSQVRKHAGPKSSHIQVPSQPAQSAYRPQVKVSQPTFRSQVSPPNPPTVSLLSPWRHEPNGVWAETKLALGLVSAQSAFRPAARRPHRPPPLRGSAKHVLPRPHRPARPAHRRLQASLSSPLSSPGPAQPARRRATQPVLLDRDLERGSRPAGTARGPGFTARRISISWHGCRTGTAGNQARRKPRPAARW